MRKEDLSFFDRAPVRHVFEASIRATRSEVFAAIADPTTWPDWFPGVRAARYRGAPPHGIGTIREADVSGTHWVEEMLAWEPDRLWAYTVVASSTPLASAQVESFELEDVPGGTRVRWTLAVEPRLLQRLGAPIAPFVIGRVFGRAMRALEARLTGVESRSTGWLDVDRLMTRLNPAVVWLLRSPLRRLLSGGLMLLTITGRRSRRRYTIPVGYQRRGDALYVLVSRASRKQWWRNFREPAGVELELRGERLDGTARVVDVATDPFREVVEETLRRIPRLGGQFGIAYDPARGLTGDQLRIVARETALVEIVLAGSPGIATASRHAPR